MRCSCLSLAACCLVAALGAQNPVEDVGLTMDGGLLTVIYGQVCGPLSCQPFPAGTVPPGERRTLLHYGAPVSPFVVALGLPGPCLQIGGIANQLLLGTPAVTLALGLTSTPPFVPTPCDQGIGLVPLTVPRTAPPGVVFRIQSLGISNSGAIAFGPALEVRTA